MTLIHSTTIYSISIDENIVLTVPCEENYTDKVVEPGVDRGDVPGS